MPQSGSSSTAIAKRREAEVWDASLANSQMAEVQRLAAAHTEDAVRSLVEIATATERELTPDETGYFNAIKDEETGEVIRKPYLPGPRSTAAKALLEHAHGRPTQRIARDGGGDTRITVVLQTFGPKGEQVEIDVTPTPEEIFGGADPPTERVETA